MATRFRLLVNTSRQREPLICRYVFDAIGVEAAAVSASVAHGAAAALAR